MSVHKKIHLGILVSLLITAIAFINFNNNAHAEYKGIYSTPTELRGNWYKWNSKKHKFDVTKIKRHLVTLNGERKFKLHDHEHFNQFNLHVTVNNSQNNFGSYYDFNNWGSPAGYWLSKQKVKGKKTLKEYNNDGLINVWTRNKVKHNYSYKILQNDYTKNDLGK